MKHKKMLIILSALMILTLVLSACAPSPNNAPADGNQTGDVVEPDADVGEEPAPSGEETTIKVMSFFAYDNPEVEAGVVEAFEAAYPNIKVELEMVPFSDIFTKYKTLVAGGEAPDVISLNFENAHWSLSMTTSHPMDTI